MDEKRANFRLARVLLALGGASLVLGMLAGLARIEWPTRLGGPAVASHAPLMVSGFLGTLICLERAVGTGWRWALLLPFISGLGALGIALGVDGARWALVLPGLGLAGLYLRLARRPSLPYLLPMAVGAAAWAMGNALWALGRPLDTAVAWWQAFLVTTIVAERLELARIGLQGRAPGALFLAGLLLLWASGSLALTGNPLHRLVAGLGMALLALWLLLYDVARRNLRLQGLYRYMGVALLSGSLWLAVGGLLSLVAFFAPELPLRDALLHSVFLGFVMGMVFAHGPLIFPSVSRLPFAYHPVLFATLALLHLSLVARVVGGLLGLAPLRSWGGLGNALAPTLFFGSVVGLAVRGRKGRSIRPAERAEGGHGRAG
ncbi:hypothetical protein HRbin23_01481 [bacterium HR23]|nr:hypothetical protein HRbin23_01481 [bacterium HR23]